MGLINFISFFNILRVVLKVLTKYVGIAISWDIWGS